MRYGEYKGKGQPQEYNSISAIYVPCSHLKRRQRHIVGFFRGGCLPDKRSTCQDRWGGHERREKMRWSKPVLRRHSSQRRMWRENSQLRVKDIERLYIESDGILGRMRRKSVPMQEYEQERKGDVYRETRVGATFLAERGNERSELAPDVWIDTRQEGSQHYVARRTALGGFDKLLYTLACQSGLGRAEQVVVIGDGAHWIWDLAEEHFPGAVQIVDLYHAQEHVWDVAHAVFVARPKRAYLGPNTHVTCSFMARLRTS